MIDILTILTAVWPRGALMTKTLGVGPEGYCVTKDYDSAYEFTVTERPIDGIDALTRVLQDIADDPQACVIRGALKAEFRNARSVRRLAIDRPDEPATFSPQPRYWLGLDLDAFPLPASIDPVADYEAVVTWAIRTLPAEFHNASFYWQLTSSHGLSTHGHCRLWCWCDRQVSDLEAKHWLRGKGVDTSLYTPVQPHYSAHPLVKGYADLVPVRHGLHRGGVECVAVPEIKPPPRRVSTGGRIPTKAAQDRLLTFLTEHCFNGHGNPPLYWTARRFAEMLHPRLLPADQAVQLMLDVVLDSGMDERKALSTIEFGVPCGRCGMSTEFDADVARLAALSPPEMYAGLKDAAQKWQIPKRELEGIVKKARTAAERAAKESSKANGKAVFDLPEFVLDRRSDPAIVETLTGLLADAGTLYTHNERLVDVVRGDRMYVHTVTHNGVIMHAHKLCQPVTYHRDELTAVTLPREIAMMYLDQGAWQVPALAGVTTGVIMRKDGTLVTQGGYDSVTQMYVDGPDVSALKVANHPTKDDAAHSLLVLRKTFQTFPFVGAKLGWIDGISYVDLEAPISLAESAWLNALLTMVARQSLWLAPGIIANAPRSSGSGVGKGKLLGGGAMIAYGVRAPARAAGKNEAEFDKQVTAALLGGGPLMFFDNVNDAMLKSQMLAVLMTERPGYARPFGTTEDVFCNSAQTMMVTGNAVTVVGDMCRRWPMRIDLDAQMEHPDTRPFRGEFIQQVEERRCELLAHVLTILRWGRQNHHTAGIPIGSYEEWAAWVRDPLNALGCQDIGQITERAKANDPARQRAAEFFESWWRHHHDDVLSISEINNNVTQLIDSGNFHMSTQYITAFVSRLTDTRAGGFVLRRHVMARGHADRYSLHQTTEKTNNASARIVVPFPFSGATGATDSPYSRYVEKQTHTHIRDESVCVRTHPHGNGIGTPDSTCSIPYRNGNGNTVRKLWETTDTGIVAVPGWHAGWRNLNGGIQMRKVGRMDRTQLQSAEEMKTRWVNGKGRWTSGRLAGPRVN